MTDVYIPYRAPRRTTALGAFAVFLPLFVVLLWWAFAHRVAPVPAGGVGPAEGTLPAAIAVLAAALFAGGSSVISAVVLSNVARLRALFRPRLTKFITALVLAFLTPVAVTGWWPELLGQSVFSGGILRGLGLVVLLTLAWYSGTTILVSGIRSKVLRVFAFALLWWQIWGLILLIEGYHAPML